jgi:tetratricopeptide (TPR) repeat protein
MASVMGQTYQGLGFPEDSLALHTVALDVALASFGEDHLMTLNARSDLSLIYFRMGDYDRATEQLLLVIPRLREQFGDGERMMKAKALLGHYYARDGQLEAADSLLIEALEYFESTYGDDHNQTLLIKGWLVTIRKSQGRIDEAATFATEAFEGVRRSSGAEHPRTLDRMNSLAGVYARQGRSVEAEELYLECLALFRQALGSDHAGTSNVCHTLGRFYLEQERYAEAESILVEGLEIRRNALGPSHRATVGIGTLLARVYRGQHRRADAYRLTRDTIDDRRRALGDEAPSVRYALYDLACFAALNGNRVEALDWLTQAADAGWHDIDLTVQAPDLESLRGDDEFEIQVERIRDNAALQQADDAASN